MASGTFELREDVRSSRRRTLSLLRDLEGQGWCRQTLYLRPGLDGLSSGGLSVQPSATQRLRDELRRKLGDGDTGLALFLGWDRALAIVPPLPLTADSAHEGAAPSRLVKMLGSDPLVGVVLLRLGRYAVGALRGDRLIASKTGSRYVKSRHRAGGSSQRRFARSRERLIRELFDKACEVTRDVFLRSGGDPDHVFLGGETHTLRAFVQRCRYLKDLESKTLGRRLAVDRPGQAALDRIALEVWKSRILTFEVE